MSVPKLYAFSNSATIHQLTAVSTPNPGTGVSPTPVCQTISNSIVGPNIIDSRRISPTSIFISWGPFPGTDTFNIHYGFENGKWLFSMNITGLSTTINALPSNQPIWVQVAATNNCTTGTFGTSVLVGGTGTTNFPIFPNTGNPLPRLPNTGIGTQEYPIGLDMIFRFITNIFSI